MYAPKYRLEAIETIGRKILLEYDRTLLEGPPQAIPIETIIETKFNLTLEYHTLRKNGSVLGETIFDDGAAILYLQLSDSVYSQSGRRKQLWNERHGAGAGQPSLSCLSGTCKGGVGICLHLSLVSDPLMIFWV